MDARLIEDLVEKNKPFRIETAAGHIFEVPHRDFIAFSSRKTSLVINYSENGAEHFAIVHKDEKAPAPKTAEKASERETTAAEKKGDR